jgi:hypothetical protein
MVESSGQPLRSAEIFREDCEVACLLSTGGIFDEVQVHVDLGCGTKGCKYKI